MKSAGDGVPQRSAVTATLRAIVAVDFAERVQCQQPGCGHPVYAAIHVVEEGGQFIVLGSSCFAKRYGNAGALGTAQFGSGGGRALSAEERAMLLQNTQDLLAHFEAQEAAEREAAARAAEQAAAAEQQRQQEVAARSSVLVLRSPTGQHWIRVQHKDGSQKLAPWPPFNGWDSALPPSAGSADQELTAIAVGNIVEALQLLEGRGYVRCFLGRWQDAPRALRAAAP